MAEELAKRGFGVLEPVQTERTVRGQVEELAAAIRERCEPPITVIGWSWGAWLASILAATHPELLSKLVMVGSGPFEAEGAKSIKATRLSRLSAAEQAEYAVLSPNLEDAGQLARAMELFDRMDAYAANGEPHPSALFDRSIHQSVWQEAKSMREAGELMKIIAKIRCPVIALHGDHDPHPAQGVEKPLRAALPSATFVLLERCGHKPWREVYARDIFYRELEAALGQGEDR